MQLNSNEQTLLAYFPSSTKATKAAEILKSIGITEIQIDRISKFGTSTNEKINNPISGRSTTASGLSLYSADIAKFEDNNAHILLASEPSVSGIAAADYGLAGGEAFLVTAIARQDQVEKAVNILKQSGGQI